MNINDIKRNSNNFKFVETLGSFINNVLYKHGYNEYLLGKTNLYSYIWNTLSAIGEDYAEIIYENVLNYLDNVSNVDLCKVKALQSMINIIGIKYDVLNTFNTIPIEIANLMDILSINRSYILQSQKFSDTFINLLSSYNVIKTYTYNESEQTPLSEELLPNKLDNINILNLYVDEDKYKEFLKTLYRFVLMSYVELPYADAEAELSTEHPFIYKYILRDMLIELNDASKTDVTLYQDMMSKLKLKYNIEKSFDPSAIIDNIENGYDSIENYNIYELEILKLEILYREQTYSYIKRYNNLEEKFLGYNLTRYSYYREKKVREYFRFIENSYNNMIIESNIINAIENTNEVQITPYDKDNQYFNLDLTDRKLLLIYDNATNSVLMNYDMISDIAQSLVDLTLEIADIRDLIKILIRKSYMRGTFLLISYVVNEFLKYGLLKKYGKYFYELDNEHTSLADILLSSFESENNVLLIEYYDTTEYFNITTDNDLSAQNGETVNDKFWDTFYNKIGQNSLDIPLKEIENFYLNLLKLKKNDVDDVTNFLSIIYEYGANNSFINRKNLEFTCKLRDGRMIGEPSREIADIKTEILSVEKITDAIDTYIERGYILSVDEISDQLITLSNFVSSYYWSEISTANESLKETTFSEYENNLLTCNTIADKLNELSVRYNDLKSNSKYSYYIVPYNEPPNSYFIELILNFNISCTTIDGGFTWTYTDLSNALNKLLDDYHTLSSDLYNRLFVLSVWSQGTSLSGNVFDYWPQYSPNYDDELTTVTDALKEFLVSQSLILNDKAMQHMQNHYDKLLSYKDEINRILEDCNAADARLESFKAAIEAATGVPNDEELELTITYWDKMIAEKTYVIDPGKYTEEIAGKTVTNYDYSVTYEDGEVKGWVVDITSYYSPAIEGTIEDLLDAIQKRCEYPHFPVLDARPLLIGHKDDPAGVGQYYGEIEGYASYLLTAAKSYTNKYADINDKGEEIVASEKCVFEYYVPKYLYAKDRPYVNIDIVEYKWKDYYSVDLANNVRSAYNNAIANLNAYIELINSEFNCIGYANVSYDDDLTMDNVREATQAIYNQLIERIDTFDDILYAGNEPNGWKSLADGNDDNLNPYLQRLNRINDINLSTSNAYNISYINNTFNTINSEVLLLLIDDADYFDLYSHNAADRLDALIYSISNYMIKRDSDSKDEVIKEITEISTEYHSLLLEFNTVMPTIKRDIVTGVNDSYAYNIKYELYKDEIYTVISDNSSLYPPITRYKDCLDYLLSGNYLLGRAYEKSEQLSGILNWIEICAYTGFENSACSAIHEKIPTLKDYIDILDIIKLAYTKYLADSLNSFDLITDKLDDIISGLNTDIDFISSLIPYYKLQKEIYLKYNGTSIGYDPFYNYKNLAYSSYQIHPYLYNFVEKSNLIYPLVNNFVMSFSETYEQDLYKKTIDDIIGRYGNIKDLWYSGMFDWTSYLSLYEKRASLLNLATNNPNIGYTGLFYPPAVEAFLKDPDVFMQDVLDDTPLSYYHHLNLGLDASNRIVNLLTAYYNAISSLTQYKSASPSLSNEYDIYKYAEDANGNQLFLLKSYLHLYNKHHDDPNYTPTYNEKKNTLGELWMRIKNHPLAFPAFDIRPGCEDISQYNIELGYTSNGKPINQYIKDINEYFLLANDEIQNYTKDIISRNLSYEGEGTQYLRCFFDFELSPTKRSILLNVPYKTGTNSRNVMFTPTNIVSTIDNIRYANSSILVAYLEDAGIDIDGIHIYNFTSLYKNTMDININIDNIANPSMLIGEDRLRDPNAENSSSFYEFVGFAKNDIYIYAIFVNKFGYNTIFNNGIYHSFKTIAKNAYIPYLLIRCVAYRLGSKLVTSYATSDALKYDIYNALRDNVVAHDANMRFKYKNAANVVLASDLNGVTIGFLTERISPTNASKTAYLSSSTIVNFALYSAMLEQYSVIDDTGIDKNYPTSTALIQTTDSDRINIYNSFDSFVLHLVNVRFNFNGSKLRYKNTQYFNLHSDLGYLPQYPDTFGKTNLFANSALANKNEYLIELLGPEKSDIPFTPIITDNADEKYGRVVEDYKEYNKLLGYNIDPIIIGSLAKYATYTFDLSTIFPDDEWTTLTSTSELLRYKYILYNTKYEALPIAKGDLSAPLPNAYYYQWEEKYDLLSGEELIGPNLVSYLNVAMTNHIDNIVDIPISVEFDYETLLPTAVHLSCMCRSVLDSELRISENTFRLMVYVKNNMKSYDYYHLFENASNKALGNTITYDEEHSIEFSTISSISTYTIPGTDKLPFKNLNSSATKATEMSAMLEFKYSEDELINREFPYLDASDVEDEIVIVLNDTQSIYYIALDNHTTIDRNLINIDTYNPTTAIYYPRRINTAIPKYNAFFDNALRIEVTYNMEKINPNDANSDYEIVLYFNYKNFTNPSYIKFTKLDSSAPLYSVYNAIDEEINHTYLSLKPHESGELQIRVDYIYYDKINETDISESVVGHTSQILKTYYIMNLSDDKPKFIISRTPFGSLNIVLEHDNYELEDVYYPGMVFRYIMLIIKRTRNAGTYSKITSIGKLKFFTKDNTLFEYPLESIATILGAGGAAVILPNTPQRLLSLDENEYFSASNCNYDYEPLSIMIDLRSQCLDVVSYSEWAWYNSPYSNTHIGYIPKEFDLAFSNDAKRWYLGDSFNDTQNIIKTMNKREAYRNTINILS